MKNIYLILFGFLAIFSVSVAQAQNNAAPTPEPQVTQTILLNDGTVLKGKLSAVAQGHYIIDTPNLGQVRIPAEKIASITAAGAAVPQAAQPTTAFNTPMANQSQMMGQVAQAQKNIMNDPEMMAEIQTLVQDPEIMKLLQDQNLMQDVMGMNPAAIESNPNIQALMQNPKMQELMNKLSQKMGTGSSPTSLSPGIPQ